ncbi:MAG: aminotransferase class I/II-fold pyridoxal phosphate-dependent enzyme, partial [Balneolaceae bacterium]|nr:aminotransferase class I/II-fold pyridoxal phosphate-dependent enzyme [Balneolaceae bacterium]
SLLQGSLLSRGDFRRFDHNDMDHLEKLLQDAQGDYERILIVTETVFSMDGDRSNVEAISLLAEQYQSLLFVDDAHAVGVWGERGRGLAAGVPGIDILLGTCGKAFGSFGSYVCCTNRMKEYLVNYCPGFIYTTALPPAVLGAIDAAVDLIPRMDNERIKYHKTILRVRNQLQKMGFDTGTSTTQIIPIILGDEESTLSLSQFLEENGVMAVAIRPPTVPEKSSRIRITLSAGHTEKHINHLLNTLEKWKDDQS